VFLSSILWTLGISARQVAVIVTPAVPDPSLGTEFLSPELFRWANLVIRIFPITNLSF
jgi:hypothetical protein